MKGFHKLSPENYINGNDVYLGLDGSHCIVPGNWVGGLVGSMLLGSGAVLRAIIFGEWMLITNDLEKAKADDVVATLVDHPADVYHRYRREFNMNKGFVVDGLQGMTLAELKLGYKVECIFRKVSGIEKVKPRILRRSSKPLPLP